MNDVADLSPGTVLVAGTTGWRYTVESETADHVVARGPHGVLRVRRDELQRAIASGSVGVRG